MAAVVGAAENNGPDPSAGNQRDDGKRRYKRFNTAAVIASVPASPPTSNGISVPSA